MSESILIGPNKATEAEVIQVPAVPFTRTFHPIHHKDVIAAIRSGVVATGMEVVKTEYVLSNEGKRMFGVWDLSGGTSELCWSLGVRNSLDKTMAMGITAGTRVFVCSNLSFTGDFVEFRRHTKGLDADDLEFIAYRAMKKMVGTLTRFQAWHEGLKQYELTEMDAKILLVEIMTQSVIPPSRFARFTDLYWNGVYAKTLWGFHEATTEILRDSNLMKMPARNKVLNDILNQFLEARKEDMPSQLAYFYEQRALVHQHHR